jgi:phosphoribosyl 1,2-cyclic phosphodiesterase
VAIPPASKCARALGEALAVDPDRKDREVAIIYSHLHLDHIQGFPFFGPIYDPEHRITVYSADPPQMTTEAVIASQMTYPSFPVGLDKVPAGITFQSVTPGEVLHLGDVQIHTCRMNHPGGAMGIRVQHRGHAFVQCSDVEHQGDTPDEALVALSRGADFLSYDSTYTPQEYEAHRGWGHSTWQAGVQIAEAAGVKTFIAFHHDPSHTDDFLDAMGVRLRARMPTGLVAQEGMTIDLLNGKVTGV